MSAKSRETEVSRLDKSRDQTEQVDLKCMPNILTRDYMFPPLEQTVVPRFWSYNGRSVTEQTYRKFFTDVFETDHTLHTSTLVNNLLILFGFFVL